MNDEPLVLGIETSCDETGIAIYDDQQGILSHQLYSQVKLHGYRIELGEIEAQLLRMAAAGWRFELRTDERADVALLTFGQSTAYDVASLASVTP